MEQEFESILEAFPVRLVNFEGPLDLLLHLIKRNEVSIYDIPITKITAQYIEVHRPDAGDEPGRGGGVPGDGGDAHPHQVPRAAAAPRPDTGRSRGRSARGAHAPPAGAPEVQGRGRAPARARDAAQRAVDPAGRADRRNRRRGARARDRSRPVQPHHRVQERRRALEGAAPGVPARRADSDRGSDRAAAVPPVGNRGAAGSRICSTTSRPAPASSSRSWRCWR